MSVILCPASRTRRLVMAVALTTLGGMLAACGSGSSAGGSDKGIYLGLSNSSVTSSFRGIMINSFKAEAKKLKASGEIDKYTVQNAGDDVSKQIQQIHNMVQSGVNVLVIDAQSSTGLNSEISRAVAQGVTVVSTDNLVDTDQSINVQVNPDTIAAKTAQGLADIIGGKGKVVMLEGIAGTPVNEGRNKLAKAVFAKYPGIKLIEVNVDWNPATSKQKTAQLISQNPDIAGIWDQGDSAGGAANAYIDAGKDLPPIVFDGTTDFLNIWHERIKDGYKTVGATQPPAVVVDALWLGIKAHKDGCKASSNPISLDTPLITNDNIDSVWKSGMTDEPGQFVNPVPVARKDLDQYLKC
jgi:ribose transport system substrate-binding protein